MTNAKKSKKTRLLQFCYSYPGSSAAHFHLYCSQLNIPYNYNDPLHQAAAFSWTTCIDMVRSIIRQCRGWGGGGEIGNILHGRLQMSSCTLGTSILFPCFFWEISTSMWHQQILLHSPHLSQSNLQTQQYHKKRKGANVAMLIKPGRRKSKNIDTGQVVGTNTAAVWKHNSLQDLVKEWNIFGSKLNFRSFKGFYHF